MALKKSIQLALANIDPNLPATAALAGLENGQPLIEFNGHQEHPLLGRSTVDLSLVKSFPHQVLVLFEQGDLEKPIVTGVLQQPGEDSPTQDDHILHSKQSLKINGKTLYLTSEQDLVIECGKSSLRMSKQGKITLKGTDIVTRAARNNKIKGASININ